MASPQDLWSVQGLGNPDLGVNSLLHTIDTPYSSHGYESTIRFYLTNGYFP